ncbi:hypothetical protein [Ideonella sp. BN130291]|uniref:hypothetical protein n=1 Tax=Ideonella sp. BN130291 TaxID=3112940 RepID=UPI002E26D3F2|nr:hypothetical protein [Ideonella sp. BN130291]
MNRLRLIPLLGLISASLLLGACASGRTVIHVPHRVAAAPYPSTARAVLLRSVEDARQFEDAPAEPSTPSLGAEPSSAASATTKARAVARKRNGYGLAQGDVLLDADDNVAAVTRAALVSAFTKAGYRVDSAGDAAPSVPTTVDVRIKKFWLWLQPGVMVGTIRSTIVVEVTMGSNPPITLQADTAQPGQIFSEEAWTQAVATAVNAFVDEAAKKLQAAP